MSWYHCGMRNVVLALVVFSALGCSKRMEASPPPSRSAPAGDFDQRWTALTGEGSEVFTIGENSGEDLMGNVRRAQRSPNPDSTSNSSKSLSNEDVQRVIRQNLPGVKACYQRIARQGSQRSGKAIVSFGVGPAGDVRDTKVDAPSFAGTSLPNCVSGTVSRWAFPKSQKGALAISYPFVFVGV